jgi:hypothetical protein
MNEGLLRALDELVEATKSGDEAAFGEKGWVFLLILRAIGAARGHSRNLLTLLRELEVDLHENPDPDLERTDERLAIVAALKGRASELELVAAGRDVPAPGDRPQLSFLLELAV